MNLEILSNSEYKNAFSLLKKGNHHPFIIETLSNNIIPNLFEKKNFLDIGSGSGEITFEIKDQFNETDIFEPNNEFTKLYKNSNINVYPHKFEPGHLKNKYDLILASHVFYYFDMAIWEELIDSFLGGVKKGGASVIIINAHNEFHQKFHETFSDYRPHSAPIIDFLQNKRNLTPKVYRSKKHDLKFSSLEDAMSVYKFLVLFDCFSPSQQANMTKSKWSTIEPKIKEFAKNTLCKEGYFHYYWEEDIIVTPHESIIN